MSDVLRFNAPGPWITRELRQCVLATDYDALTARVAHLEKYAGCRWTCDSRILDDNDATKPKGLPCTCGFQFADGEKPCE